MRFHDHLGRVPVTIRACQPQLSRRLIWTALGLSVLAGNAADAEDVGAETAQRPAEVETSPAPREIPALPRPNPASRATASAPATGPTSARGAPLPPIDDPQEVPARPALEAPVSAHDVAPAADGSFKALVLPFTSISGRPEDAWIGQSLQQTLLADLFSKSSQLQSVVGSAPAADPTIARQAARDVGAKYVIFGQVHVNESSARGVDRSVRITGQVLDVDSATRPVAMLKATGTMGNVFELEDTLANQARRAFVAAGAEPPARPAPAAPTIAPSGPVRLDRAYEDAFRVTDRWYDYDAAAPAAEAPRSSYNQYYFYSGYPLGTTYGFGGYASAYPYSFGYGSIYPYSYGVASNYRGNSYRGRFSGSGWTVPRTFSGGWNTAARSRR